MDLSFFNLRKGDDAKVWTHTQFHEQAKGRTPSWASVGPEDDIVICWVTPTLEEVEKEVLLSDVDVPGVRTAPAVSKMYRLD